MGELQEGSRSIGPFNTAVPRIGYVLAGEEHLALDLIEHGTRAEEAGFSFAFVSDHFHPWSEAQGHGSSIWPVLGALSTSTSSLELISAVTCPLFRMHPTFLAQAVATVSHLSRGRFTLGLGTGENLNEHVVGLGWPPFDERQARLEECVTILRALFAGGEVGFQGRFWQVERAQLFDAPTEQAIYLAASGPKAAKLAHRLGDGLVSLGADAEVAKLFADGETRPRPRVTQVSVCWASTEAEARRTAHRLWPMVALPGAQYAQLATPAEFQAACAQISEDDVAAAIVCGHDVDIYEQAIRGCFEAGFDGVALHQIGPDQEGFFQFWERDLAPRFF